MLPDFEPEEEAGLNSMTEDSPQEISSPTHADIEQMAAQRQLIERYLADELSRQKYKTPAGKLGTLRAMLAASIFDATQTHELQSMGIVLGDVFVQDMGFHWVIVEDSNGRDPALQYLDTSVILYPLTMISKRIERGETVDVFDLYNGIADLAQQQIDQGR